jgi:DNA repair protein RadA/Sms
MEGTRPLLIEVQALVSVTSYGTPQRSATGFDSRRLQMILAVLEKRLGVPIGRHDVFINIAGGLRIDDPAADLAVAAAVLGSWRDRVIPSRTVVMGEVSLTGEIRSVSHIDQRLGEAAKLGFTGALIPHGNRSSAKKMAGMDVRPADRLVAGLAFLYGDNAE